MVARLQRALSSAYRVAQAKGVPLALRPILSALEPRLKASLEHEPERAIAVLVWLWARLPEVIGEAVDLTDHERVATIVARVELNEGLTAPSSSSPGEPAEPPSATST